MPIVDRGKLLAMPEHSTFEAPGETDGEVIEWELYEFRYQPDDRPGAEVKVRFAAEHVGSDHWSHLEVGRTYDFRLGLSLGGNYRHPSGTMHAERILLDVTTPQVDEQPTPKGLRPV